jgi:hypothetical protein
MTLEQCKGKEVEHQYDQYTQPYAGAEYDRRRCELRERERKERADKMLKMMPMTIMSMSIAINRIAAPSKGVAALGTVARPPTSAISIRRLVSTNFVGPITLAFILSVPARSYATNQEELGA